eukprot:s4053_g9.t1
MVANALLRDIDRQVDTAMQAATANESESEHFSDGHIETPAEQRARYMNSEQRGVSDPELWVLLRYGEGIEFESDASAEVRLPDPSAQYFQAGTPWGKGDGELLAHCGSASHGISHLSAMESSLPESSQLSEQDLQLLPNGKVLLTGTWLEKGRRLFGDEKVTNRSHVIDKHLVTKLFANGMDRDDAFALRSLLQDVRNLPLKNRDENFDHDRNDSDINLDKEIMRALDTDGQLRTVDPNGRRSVELDPKKLVERVQVKLGLWKGLAKDFGMSDETVKSVLLPMARLKGPDGQPIDKNEYPSCWKEGKPYNLFKDLPSSITGMREDGKPDRETLEGQARVMKTFEQECGMTKNFEASQRSNIGKELGFAKDQAKNKVSGLRKDGQPDQSTRNGQDILAQRQARAERKGQQREETKAQEEQPHQRLPETQHLEEVLPEAKRK